MKKTVTTSIRVPADIFDKIRNTARKERRSINQQILLYLEDRIKAQEAEQKQEAVGIEIK